MTPFAVFMMWLGLIYLLVQWRAQPLQPSKIEDDLTDVDIASHAYRRLMREADWLSSPRINVRLSGRWVKR